MASGNTLLTFYPLDNEPPASNPATLGLRNVHPILEFDAAVAQGAVFKGILPAHYAGGGLTVRIHWVAASATSGTVAWNAAIERIGEGVQNIDSDGFAAAQAGNATAPATSGLEDVQNITFTSGAQMDSLAIGEEFRLKITRDVTVGGNMTGDAQLTSIEVLET